MVQQKFINRYVNVSKTTKLCQHKFKTQGQHVQPANTKTRCEICSEVIIKKTELKVENWKSLCPFYLRKLLWLIGQISLMDWVFSACILHQSYIMPLIQMYFHFLQISL